MRLFLIAALLMSSTAVYGQQPVAEIAPAQPTVTVTTETEVVNEVPGEEEVGVLPTTGGAPLLLVLAGGMLAGGSFLLRRKI